MEHGRIVIRFGPRSRLEMENWEESPEGCAEVKPVVDEDVEIKDDKPEVVSPSENITVAERQSEFFIAMNAMRNCDELCDVTLNISGTEIKAHRVVLAACSRFFHAMFTTKMSEAKTSKVDLKDVSHKTVEAIVDFAYTANINLTDENVQELLSAANQYQIQPIKDACCNYLRAQLTATNCLGIRDFAEFHNCPDLHQAAQKFVYDNFRDVFKAQEYLRLGVSSVTELLSKDELTVKCEDEVYDAATRWLKHDAPERLQYKRQVLEQVRFPLITRRYLSCHVQNDDIIQDCCECLRLVMTGMNHHLLANEEKEELQLATVKPRVKKYEYQIALFGGSEPATCQYFDPKDHSWTDFQTMNEKRRDHTVARVGTSVYVIGGSYLFTTSRVDCFNVASGTWSTMTARLEIPRDCLASCAKGDLIYLCGGTQSHGSTALPLFGCYNPKVDRFTELKNMSLPRFDHVLVECRGNLYALGGATQNNKPLKHCEQFSLMTVKWSDIPAMNVSRRGLGAIVWDNKIYAFGGSDESGAVDSVECYDPVHGQWTMKAKMPYKLRTVKCAVINDSVWVVGGYRDMGRLSNVLEYKLVENKWVFHFNTRAFPICNVALETVDTCVVE